MSGIPNIDPSGLERVAQALREIAQNPHASEAFHLAALQEQTKIEQNKTWQKEKDVQKVKTEQEERRLTLDKTLDINKRTSDYNDKLERQRISDSHKAKELAQKRLLEMQEQSLAKQEKLRRDTINYEQKKQESLIEKQEAARATGEIKIQKETFQLQKERISLTERERRQTLHEIWSLALSQVSSGFSYLAQNPKLAMTAGLYAAVLTGAFYFTKGGIGLGWRRLEGRLSQPRLVRETSRLTLQNARSVLKIRLQQRFGQIFGDKSFKKPMERLIVNEQFKQELLQIAQQLKCHSRQNIPFRNLLFYGPPGTGKTLFARLLAMHSGLDYAIVNGSDISPQGANAPLAIHSLIDWAESSRKRVIIFIDEAEAFLRKRQGDQTTETSETLRNAINSFLQRTGTPSKHFLFILATNMPEYLDMAVLDRVDRLFEFPKPVEALRLEIIKLYLEIYCSNKNLSWSDRLYQALGWQVKIEIDKNVDDKFIQNLAAEADDFSARELEKYIIECHDKA